jgi:hypothetical protein
MRERIVDDGPWSYKVYGSIGWIHHLEEANARLAMHISDLEKRLELYEGGYTGEESEVSSNQLDLQSIPVF